MNARRILAISRRIASQFRRDHRTMALLFVVPLVVTALLGWVIRDQERGDVRLGIVASQLVAERVGGALDAAPGIDYLVQADSADAARALIRDGQVDIVLVFRGLLMTPAAATGRRRHTRYPRHDRHHPGR